MKYKGIMLNLMQMLRKKVTQMVCKYNFIDFIKEFKLELFNLVDD